MVIIVIASMIAISIIPTVQGWGGRRNRNFVIRSLDDWLYNVTGGPLNPDVGGWASDTLSDPLVIWPHYDRFWELTAVWDCEKYYGFVIDREMSDGRRMITVNMLVKGVPVFMRAIDPVTGSSMVIFEGTMNYLYRYKFIIDLEVWPYFLIPWADDDGYDENGNVLLPVGFIPLFYGSALGCEFVSILFMGSGKGEMLNDWNDLEQGECAEFSVGMLGIAQEEPDVEWPIDFIKVY